LKAQIWFGIEPAHENKSDIVLQDYQVSNLFKLMELFFINVHSNGEVTQICRNFLLCIVTNESRKGHFNPEYTYFPNMFFMSW